MTAAAVLSMKLANYFRPKYLVACGIAAGLRNAGIGMGDLLIADQTWDYESGKKKIAESGEVFLPDPKYIPLQNSLKERLIATIGEGAYLADIEAGWNAARPGTKLRAHIGPVASGSAIIQNEKIIDGIQRQARKVIGLEMETYGVFFAGENCTRPKPIPFSIKGACDYADSQKNDDYQEYAAYTSAQYICRFALDHLGEELHP